jgi:apolipoprotein D and lipocalin family protein
MKNKLMVLVSFFFLVLGFQSQSASFAQTDTSVPTVSYVDLNRYLGTWYEQARLDQWFQKDCGASSANYSLRSDGDIKVINSCFVKDSQDGKTKSSEGRAWVVDPATNAKLKVQFFLSSILRIPFFAGNYWILAINDNADDYEYALIGDNSKKYLWILSREKKLDEVKFQKLVKYAKSLGFPVEQLLRFEQP